MLTAGGPAHCASLASARLLHLPTAVRECSWPNLPSLPASSCPPALSPARLLLLPPSPAPSLVLRLRPAAMNSMVVPDVDALEPSSDVQSDASSGLPPLETLSSTASSDADDIAVLADLEWTPLPIRCHRPRCRRSPPIWTPSPTTPRGVACGNPLSPPPPAGGLHAVSRSRGPLASSVTV